MPVLTLNRSWTAVRPKTSKRGAVFGSLDGIHLGHQALISQLNSWKNKIPEREAWVITLYPHPMKVLKKQAVKQLSSLSQTYELLDKNKIDVWQMLKFSKLVSQMQPEKFVKKVFIELCQLDYLVLGQDAAVGKDRQGDVNFLKSELAKYHCEVTVVPELRLQGAKIGSRYIRAAIEAGDPVRAAELLGRLYTITGHVKKGASRGRQLGYRTANINPSNYVMPAYGVYLVKVNFNNQSYNAVANIGVRPTFGVSEPVLEVHLLNYNGPEFYDQKVAVQFIQRLRPENKFASVDELKGQIALDIAAANNYFNKE